MKPNITFNESITVREILRNNLIFKEDFYMQSRKSIWFPCTLMKCTFNRIGTILSIMITGNSVFVI